MESNPLDYYAQPGTITDLSRHADWLADLPTTLPALCAVVQGLLIHIFWAESYGVTLSEERQQEVQIRPAAEMLERIRAVDDRPPTIARPPDQRLVGNCRDFTVLLTALLRHQGRPARARCGFGTYFKPDHHEDHWVCEVRDDGRWRLVDAQLDDLQCEALKPDFDPLDVPRDRFLTGGKGWQLCRAGQADPDTFGIFEMKGLWFIRGNLVRDLAALNKVELLPWDCWGLIEGQDAELSGDDMALLDRAAELTLADDSAFPELRALYEGEPGLRVSPTIRSWVQDKAIEVAIDDII